MEQMRIAQRNVLPRGEMPIWEPKRYEFRVWCESMGWSGVLWDVLGQGKREPVKSEGLCCRGQHLANHLHSASA